MEYEIKCECGVTHRAKCANVVIERGVLSDVPKYVNQYLSAGKIAVLYLEEEYDRAKTVEKALKDDGYDITSICIPQSATDISLYTSSLSEEERLIVAIGSEEVAKIAESLHRKFILIMTKPTTDRVIEYSPVCVLADLDVLHSAQSEAHAAGFGELYAKLVMCYDYMFLQTFAKDRECQELIDIIRRELEGFFALKFKRGSMEFTTYLVQTLMSVGLYTSMLTDSDTLNSYRIYAELIKAYTNSGRYIGEYTMLAAYYLQTLYRIALSKKDFGLCYPPDKIECAETLLKLCSKDISSTLSSIKILDAKSVGMRDYVLGVHRTALLENFAEVENLLLRGGQTFRRLYDDAGYSLTREVKLDKLASIISAGSILIPTYTLAKHYKEIGVI